MSMRNWAPPPDVPLYLIVFQRLGWKLVLSQLVQHQPGLFVHLRLSDALNVFSKYLILPESKQRSDAQRWERLWQTRVHKCSLKPHAGLVRRAGDQIQSMGSSMSAGPKHSKIPLCWDMKSLGSCLGKQLQDWCGQTQSSMSIINQLQIVLSQHLVC